MWKKVILLGLGLSVAILSTAVFLYLEAAYRPPLPYWVQRGQHMGKLAAKWPDDWDKQPLNMHPNWFEHEVHLLQEWDTYLRITAYAESVAHNNAHRARIAAGLETPCACGFDAPDTELTLRLRHKALHAPVRQALLHLAATAEIPQSVADKEVNMALWAAQGGQWELARLLVQRGCNVGALVGYVFSAPMPEEELRRWLDFFHTRGELPWEDDAAIYTTARRSCSGYALLEWAWEHAYLQRADVYALLKQKGTLPLMQRMHAAGKLSLAAHARQQHPTPVQQLIIVAAPPVDEGFCMEDALQKLEWMLAHGANPNAMPHRRSTRGDARYRPLNMCRRVMQQCDRQVLPAWQRMEHLLLQYGAQ